MSPWWLLAGLGILLIGVTKSGFGGAVGLFVVPLIALALGHIPARGSEAALGLLLPLLVMGDLIAVYQYRRSFSWPTIRSLLPATAAGVVIGGLLLWWFHRQGPLVGSIIRLEVGAECILLVAIHWWRQARGIQERLLPEPF